MADGSAQVKVTLRREESGRQFFRVQVFSIMKPGVSKHGDVWPEQEGNFDKVMQKIEIMGGACAEKCIEDFGDAFEPEECARAALVAMEELLHKLAAKRN